MSVQLRRRQNSGKDKNNNPIQHESRAATIVDLAEEIAGLKKHIRGLESGG